MRTELLQQSLELILRHLTRRQIGVVDIRAREIAHVIDLNAFVERVSTRPAFWRHANRRGEREQANRNRCNEELPAHRLTLAYRDAYATTESLRPLEER